MSAGLDTDDADPWTVLAAVRACALSWRPEARILGDVRAGDIARAIQALARQHHPEALSKAASGEAAPNSPGGKGNVDE